MRFVSTRGEAPAVDLAAAVTSSLAPDGGLYLPEAIEPLAPGRLAALRGAPFPELALALAGPFLADLPPGERRRIVEGALDFPVPLVHLVVEAKAEGQIASAIAQVNPAEGQIATAIAQVNPAEGQIATAIILMELFHGPTLAFKDFGARFLARLLASLRRGEDRPLTVLVATSGDTGGAVAHAFLGVPGTRVAVLYPAGQVTPVQERQFTTLGENVRAFAVAGVFDDCQRMVKAAFADASLARDLALTSANSINFGRLLPQAFYYVHAALALPAGAPPPRFTVPSGNFGNLTAGLLARRLALPAARFVAATNANDVVPAFLAGAPYAPRPSRPTISSAMDVGDPSNFARIAHLAGVGGAGDPAALRRALAPYLAAFAFDDGATRRAIARVHAETGYLLDPHTAVGWLAAAAARAADPTPATDVLLATAHPAKFREVIEPVLGEKVPLPPRLAACLEREHRAEPLAADADALAERLRAWAG